MARWAANLRKTGYDGTSITEDPFGRLQARTGNSRLPFASTFYVDGNRVSSGGGKTWKTAFKTLAEGLAAAHAFQGLSANRAWAQRSTVYCVGDALTEDLTKFAEKTDVIGVGTTNQHPRTRLEGNHVLEAATTDTYHGCVFHNIEFYSDAAGIIVDIPINQNGIGFDNCVFSAIDAATIGLRAVQAHDMFITNCRFDPNTSGAGFSTAAIQINAGSVTNFLLENCRIHSSAIGLDFNPTAGQAINCWAIDNVMATVGMGIDSEDDSATSGLLVVGNRMITDIDTTTVTDGYDFVLARAIDNVITGKDETDAVPYVLQA